MITEIQALKILAGVESTHVASGGCSGSEGTVTLVAEGETSAMAKAIEVVESLKGEPPLQPKKGNCMTCVIASPAQPKDYDTEGFEQRCLYEAKPEEELPEYLKNR